MPSGRQLQCKKCAHIWFVEPPVSTVTAAPLTDTPLATEATTAAQVTPSPTEPPSPTPDAALDQASLNQLANVNKLPRWLRRGLQYHDKTTLIVLAVLAIAIIGAAIWWFYPRVQSNLPGHATPSQQKEQGVSTPSVSAPAIPPQPAGLMLGDIQHQLTDTPNGPALTIKGFVSNTSSSTLALPELQVQLLTTTMAAADTWPATLTDTTLNPGQSTAWQATFPQVNFAKLASYRVFFIPVDTKNLLPEQNYEKPTTSPHPTALDHNTEPTP